MVEIELKFQIPGQRREALRRELAARGTVERLRLQARYFDTADDRLAATGLALRLRKEGRSRWVQTLKGRGDGLMHRLEHEVVLAPGEAASIDLARHDGSPAGKALRQALGSPPGALVERFATDIRRSRRVVRTRSATGGFGVVEIALDEGWLIAGAPPDANDGASTRRSARRVPVCEIEFELLDGSPQALLGLAARWVRRHGLWLDVRSKAERGHALASGRHPAAVRARAPELGRRMAPQRAFAAMLQSVLAHLLPNLAVVAEAAQAQAEHLHQLRVALRRLRTLLREFGPGLSPTDAAASSLLAEVFGALGGLRDREVVEATLRPAREAARQAAQDGAPCADDAAAPGGSAAPPLHADETAALRASAFNALLLGLIGRAAAPPGRAEAGSPTMRALARKRLAHLHERVANDAARFATHDDEARHALRKRLKRLRYSIGFVAPLFAKKPLSRYLAPLEAAQQALGDYNDVVVAQAALRERRPAEPFVLGWLAARREMLQAEAAMRLAALAKAPRFWRDKG